MNTITKLLFIKQLTIHVSVDLQVTHNIKAMVQECDPGRAISHSTDKHIAGVRVAMNTATNEDHLTVQPS